MISRKTIFLIFLNMAAAAALGIIGGLLYKYSDKTAGTSDPHFPAEMIASAAGNIDARVGVAVIHENGTAFEAGWESGKPLSGDSLRFPMLSVVKFHQALAVCDWMKTHGLDMESEITVGAHQLHADTWSPMRDARPDGGTFSYGELLEYTLEQSDNNACDILFGLTGGPENTAKYLKSVGLDGFGIECTEYMMHENPENCHLNWSTPESAARLLEKFYEQRDSDVYHRFLWTAMTECRTGQNRIPGHISGRAAAIVHKTGTGDINPDGKIMAVNDIGIIVMPDGSHFSIAVFIADAACDMASCEETIAGITECVFNFFDRNNKKNLQRKKCWLSLQSQTNSEGSSLKSVS